jgi:hypothetical protein
VRMRWLRASSAVTAILAMLAALIPWASLVRAGETWAGETWRGAGSAAFVPEPSTLLLNVRTSSSSAATVAAVPKDGRARSCWIRFVDVDQLVPAFLGAWWSRPSCSGCKLLCEEMTL